MYVRPGMLKTFTYVSFCRAWRMCLVRAYPALKKATNCNAKRHKSHGKRARLAMRFAAFWQGVDSQAFASLPSCQPARTVGAGWRGDCAAAFRQGRARL